MNRFKAAGAALAFALAALAPAAHAEDIQRGMSARALTIGLMLETARNRASLEQRGNGHSAAIVQNGAGNSADLRQYGRDNTGAITQTGDGNLACLVQVGRGLDGAIVQVGDGQSLGIVQTRQGVREIPPEMCALGAGNRGYWQSTARSAVRRALY